MLVVLTPIWLHFYYGIESSIGNGAAMGGVGDLSMHDAAILIACCIGAVGLGRLLRLPGPEFFGPMALSAAVHLLGGTAARPPSEVIVVAQILLGTSIGCRFAGYSIVRVFKTLALAGVTTCILMFLAVLATLLVTALVDLEEIALILSFVPGSLAVMTLLSLTLGADTALVTAHHLCRMITIVLLTPLLCRLVVGKAPPREGVD
jgi:membrane AbrB-like protein